MEASKADTFTSVRSTSVTGSTEDMTVAENRKLSIERIEQSSYSVDSLNFNVTTSAAADIVRYSGNISVEDQEDWYSFTATYEGRYRIDLTEIQNGTDVKLYLYDDLQK